MSGARYSTVAIALHWLLALLVLTQIYVGWTFGDMPRGPERGEWFAWHKTLGVTILLLTVVRLGWRIANPPPPFPAEMPAWQKLSANVVHWAFYAVILGLALTGWAAISTGGAAQTSATTELVAGIPWPFIPGLPRDWHEPFEIGHDALVKVTYALLAAHVGAALYHQFIEKSPTANRMPPFGVKR